MSAVYMRSNLNAIEFDIFCVMTELVKGSGYIPGLTLHIHLRSINSL